MENIFNETAGGTFCLRKTVGRREIEAFLAEQKESGKESVRVQIPQAQTDLFKDYGFCVDGVLPDDGTAFLHKSFVFDGCDVLAFDPAVSAVLTRTRFTAANIAKAELDVTALGFFEATINGKKPGDEVLIPAKSDYVPRDLSDLSYPLFDTASHRIYYYRYDITPLLVEGDNVLGVHIGAGWFADNKNPAENVPRWGDDLLVYKLTLTRTDGSVAVVRSAPANTKWKPSFIEETSLYFGERHNYRKWEKDWDLPGYDDTKWFTPRVITLKDTFFAKADYPGDRVGGSIVPKEIARCGDRKMYDLGETASGWPIIRFTDRCINCEAYLRYADVLNEDGSMNFHYTGGLIRMQTDTYIYDPRYGDNEIHPYFTWHAARYIELTGGAEIVRFDRVQTPLKLVVFFESDSEELNWLFKAYMLTQEANVHGCVPSDCPHRERLGYTGDGQLSCGAVMSVYDARAFYKKWIRDILDCQDIYTGHVQHTAPLFGGGGGPGGWGGAVVIVPYRYWKFYADESVLHESYNAMKAYIRYMRDHCEDGLVAREEPKGWCLGDWCTPEKITIPEPFVNTYFLAKCADMCKEIAETIGRDADAPYFAKTAEDARRAFVRHYFDEKTGSFFEGIQGADAFAVDLGVGDERTLNNLIAKYDAFGAFDTGIFGTDILIRVLFRNGQAELAYRLLTNDTPEHSFIDMRNKGATNIWEQWDGNHSHCHPMFGAVIEYCFSEILGIRRLNDKPGFSEITVCPADIPALKNVSGRYVTPSGTVNVEIRTDENGCRKVSVNATGDIRITKT